jgi:hypothetical protein
MVHERDIAEDLKTNAGGLICVVSRHFVGVTEKKFEAPVTMSDVVVIVKNMCSCCVIRAL